MNQHVREYTARRGAEIVAALPSHWFLLCLFFKFTVQLLTSASHEVTVSLYTLHRG